LDSSEKKGEEAFVARLQHWFLILMTFTCLHQMSDLYISCLMFGLSFRIYSVNSFMPCSFDPKIKGN